MRIKPFGKLMILLMVIAVAYGGWRLWQNSSDPAQNTSGDVPPAARVSGEQGILGRPLRVGVVSWPGYGGGIVANNGFKPNRQSIYWNNHQLLVEFLLLEDMDARSKAFARGGPDGVDIVWSTVDFWANELPGFSKNGVNAKAVMQVDWSRGGDAIVVDGSIRRVEDLKGKKIALALFTPSHWLLEYSLQNSSLSETEQTQIVKSLVGKNASPDARADFVAGKVDACVVWEPDVVEALQKRRGARILLSSETAANLIADVMVAKEDFIRQHPQVIKAFVQGWLEGTEEANRNPDLAVKLLMENEPLYKDLGEEITRDGITKVKWADLADNVKMFGLDGSQPLFDRLFRQASETWVRRGYITYPVAAAQAKDDRFLREIYAALPAESRVKPPKEEFRFPERQPAEKATERPIMTKPVNIFFRTGSADLDPNALQVLDQVALVAQTYSNAYIRVEGNTDSVGNTQRNIALSKRRAESVVNYLVKRYGFNKARFIAKGNGPNNPIASNTTEPGRAKNRRTDVMVIPR